MQPIYYCEDSAYRCERDFLSLTTAAERRKAVRVTPPPKLRNTEPFYLLHYSAEISGSTPEAVTTLQDVHEQFLRLGLITRVALMTWNGAFYSPSASIAARS